MTDRCRHCVTRGLMCYGCRDNPERATNPKLFEKGEKEADGMMVGHAHRVAWHNDQRKKTKERMR